LKTVAFLRPALRPNATERPPAIFSQRRLIDEVEADRDARAIG
jgi:hypothetical protein